MLVFFLVSIISLLGVFALSFDMGRRASTQTDMQSFADSVALAAAGELDGSANAIANARSAATSVIIAANERLKAGTGVSAAGLTITFDANADLVFYSELPDQDRPNSYDVASLAASKYTLPTANTTTNSRLARFVGVTLDTRDVDWLFAGAVTNNAPSAAVGAIAIAGNAGYTCEIAPLMFCLPRDTNGIPKTLVAGQAVRLETSGGPNTFWNAGQFGYLDIDDAVQDNGPCAGLNPESRRQACLLARGLGACFSNRGVDIQTGQRAGQEIAGFNLPFGVFTSTMNQFKGDPLYATGPHAISGQIHTNNCNIDNNATVDTMAFPEDDCLVADNCADGRFGDGNWSNGRALYVDTNYSFTKPDGTPVPGSYFDFPETNLTRYQYYQREIERAANGGVMTAAGTPPYAGSKYTNDAIRGPVNNYDSWDDYWDDSPSGFNPIIPDAHGRTDNGLPQCSAVEASSNADRRVVIVAGIDCPPGLLQGDEDDVPVVQYYRTFLLQPARNANGGGNNGGGGSNNGGSNNGGGNNGGGNNGGGNNGGGNNGGGNNGDDGDGEDNAGGGGGGGGTPFEIFVEIIEPIGGEGGGSTTVTSAFREMVQLYR